MLRPFDIKAQAQKLWDREQVLRDWIDDGELFPYRVVLKPPPTGAIAERFDAIREWAKDLRADSERYGYRLDYVNRRHPRFGEQRLPAQAVFDSRETLLAYVNKRQAFIRFQNLYREAVGQQPLLAEWFYRRPLAALEYLDDWPRLLNVIAYFQRHPRPRRYLRELDIPEVDTKFIEPRRKLFNELLTLCLPAEAIDGSVSGTTQQHGFERRFGLRYEQPQLRFRLLDSGITVFGGLRDIAVPLSEFQELDPPVETVYITENKLNGLSFPDRPGSLVIFGLGYGLQLLNGVAWLNDKAIRYWGDIDTHGFAMLSQLRGYWPQTESLLMDRRTLLDHRALWVSEPKPHPVEPPRLQPDEAALYRELIENVHGKSVRLEQERVRFAYLETALARE